MRFEERPAGVPHNWQRVAECALDWVVAEHERAAEVGFPALEDRPEVAEDDVVAGDHPVRRVLPVWLQRVRPGAHDPLVPVPVHAEHLRREIANCVAHLNLALPGRFHPALLDRRE